MRISDWSSDVCSSDLAGRRAGAEDRIPDAGLAGHDAALRTVFGRIAPLSGERVVHPVGAVVVLALVPGVGAPGDGVGGLHHHARIHHLGVDAQVRSLARQRSEGHTSELQSLMRISSAVFSSKKTTQTSYHIQKQPHALL